MMKNARGQAAAAESNRRREVRLGSIQAFFRLGIPYSEWPDFVKVYYADPHQQNQYCQNMLPLPFHAPDFDRLNQSPAEWKKAADTAWTLHRNRFLEECQNWVKMGVDEEIVWKERPRGPGNREFGRGRRRADNTAIDQRFVWAAQYLARVPLKQIAGEHADPSTVGRIAREIVRSAGWPTRSRRKPGFQKAIVTSRAKKR
jgi:hypothetical protein